MSKKRLRPCPFCSSKEEDFGNHPETCFLYRIKKQAKTDCMAYFKEDCEEAWERRPIETNLEAEIKRLKETINYAIGGIDALLPDNEDAKAIKETLEQGVK